MDPVAEATDRYLQMLDDEEQALWAEEDARERREQHLNAMARLYNLAYCISAGVIQ